MKGAVMRDKAVELRKDEWYKLCFAFRPSEDCTFAERKVWQGFHRLLGNKAMSVLITDTHLTLISFNGRKLE